jgi:SAM-dependent methyltransferase
MQLHWPAPERNKLPILDILKRVLPGSRRGTLLEIASGSGQHAVFFASELRDWIWQPSDVDPQNLASVRAYREAAQLANLQPEIRLDVRVDDWSIGPLDAVFCANMIHIAPWECCEGLLRGAARHLRSGGKLILYGPFQVAGQHTSDSNREFDADLRMRDARWGVRDLDAVALLAENQGLRLCETVAMPANNQAAVFERT